MRQALTWRALNTLGYTLEHAKGAKIKRANQKAMDRIDEALDLCRGPKQGYTGTGATVDLEGTGPGCENWRFVAGSVDFSCGDAEVLQAWHEEILDGEGYPGTFGRGPNEVTEALKKWTAKVSGGPEGTPSEPSADAAVDA